MICYRNESGVGGTPGTRQNVNKGKETGNIVCAQRTSFNFDRKNWGWQKGNIDFLTFALKERIESDH